MGNPKDAIMCWNPNSRWDREEIWCWHSLGALSVRGRSRLRTMMHDAWNPKVKEQVNPRLDQGGPKTPSFDCHRGSQILGSLLESPKWLFLIAKVQPSRREGRRGEGGRICPWRCFGITVGRPRPPSPQQDAGSLNSRHHTRENSQARVNTTHYFGCARVYVAPST